MRQNTLNFPTWKQSKRRNIKKISIRRKNEMNTILKFWYLEER